MTVIFIRGDDETLVAQAVKSAVDGLVGDGDRSLMVDEVGEEAFTAGEETTPAPLITSAQTMPFLTERRVVVGRNLALFSKAATVMPLVEFLAAAPDTTDLVLVWERASTTNRMPPVPKTLTEALKTVGAEMVDAAPSGRGRKTMLDERLATAPVRLDAGAKRAIADHLGDEVGRLAALIDVLVSTFGRDAAITADQVTPFLGQASDVPPWELTDAIDGGDITTALVKLSRMSAGGGRHPLQTLATLHNHYQRALRLDGAPVFDEKSAAAHLNMSGSTFPAKKALALSRRLGSGRLHRATALLAEADVNLRGASGLPADTVITVLVARLARLSR